MYREGDVREEKLEPTSSTSVLKVIGQSAILRSEEQLSESLTRSLLPS